MPKYLRLSRSSVNYADSVEIKPEDEQAYLDTTKLQSTELTSISVWFKSQDYGRITCFDVGTLLTSSTKKVLH